MGRGVEEDGKVKAFEWKRTWGSGQTKGAAGGMPVKLEEEFT